MNRNKIVKKIILFISVLAQSSFGQISPGELANAHAQFESISNCTKCHDMGKQIIEEKCFDCHKEILTKNKSKSGYHFQVSKKNCVECHSDHHGRDFKIVNLDKKKFDHSLTGFVLEGKHKIADCKKCHNKEKITDTEILKFKNERLNKTYLGLPTTCIDCHKDVHNGELNQKCETCHNSEKWKPAKKFSHNNSIFKLDGAHKKIDCKKCHPKHFESLKFKNIKHENCKDCHEDFHKGKFKENCESCHKVESWNIVNIKKEFNHSLTQYPLLGKHKRVDCDACHKKKNKSDFALPKFSKCFDCHEDYHKGEFKNRKDKGECSSCHNVEGFIPSTYNFVTHRETRFPILGAHVAILCKDCHKKNQKKDYVEIKFHWDEKLNCKICHEDIHKGKFTSEKINCETCHSSISWSKLIFNHSNTKFSLKGKHTQIKCEKCHLVDGKEKFSFEKTNCESCHKDLHENQFSENGKTLCEKCHKEKSWKELYFAHNRDSKYILDGKHEKVACEKCHYQIILNNKKIIRYRGIDSSCQSCHTNIK